MVKEADIVKRQLTENERAILNKLLEHSFEGSEAIKAQLANCIAIPTGDEDNYGSIYLKTESDAKAETQSRVPVEAITFDSDGGAVDILLHVVDGLVKELEIVKSDGSQLLASIDPKNMTVTVN